MRLRTCFLLGLGLGLAIPIVAGLGRSVAWAEVLPREEPKETSELTFVGLTWVPDDSKPFFGPYPRSEKIIAIEEALERSISFDFVETRLADVVTFFRQQTKLNIVLDEVGLAMCGVDQEIEVTLRLHDVSFKSALKLLLDRIEMEYLLREGVILITDKIDSGATLEVRVYPVADLVTARGLERSAILSDELIYLIKDSVCANDWASTRGTGSISFSPTALSLVVAHRQSVHAEIEGLLSNLRAARERLNSPISGDRGRLSNLQELYLKRRDKEQASKHEQQKRWIEADTIERQTAQAELRRMRAEAELAELKLQQAKKKAEDKQKKRQGKDSD